MAFLFGAKQDTMVPYVAGLGCVVSDSDSIVPVPDNAYSQAWEIKLGSCRLLLREACHEGTARKYPSVQVV